MELRQGAHREFFEEDVDRGIIAAAHGSKSSGSPDARSGEPSANSAFEVSGTLASRWPVAGRALASRHEMLALADIHRISAGESLSRNRIRKRPPR
jgi:hypothetical protein